MYAWNLIFPMKTDRKEEYNNFQLDRYVLIERENIKQKKQNKIK